MKEVILLGAGDSITEGLEKGLWNKIKDKEIWSLNSMFKIMPYIPTRQIWVDRTFFIKSSGEIQQLHKKGVELHCKKHNYYAFIGDMVKQYDAVREREFFKDNKIGDVSHVYFGGHGLVGIFALSIAIREKYEVIYLLGYDWGSISIDQRKTHCYQDKIKELNIYSTGAGNPEIYINTDGTPNKWIKDWEVFEKEETKIYNVSPLSHINNFQKLNYEEFFEKIK
ncbi:hypothetical protein LCGC14_1070600 [marine sediment metagenome]|uniref:Uncharacterized protein n=1 Tax=marine sediment metagenome TaxID=412755 RepID=A0A0F9N5I5_9ZZZZ